jgi:geranylgeranyl reductase family protein
MWDVIVIGGGPAGSWTARGFAKAGLKTAVLEEHSEIGIPIHCTGVVGGAMLEQFPQTKSCVWREVNQFKIFSPEGESFLLPNVKAFILNRQKLDLTLAHEAQKEGALILLNHKVSTLSQEASHVTVEAVTSGEKTVHQAKMVVLATGSTSNLARQSHLGEPPQFIRGVQVEIEIENLPTIELYLGSRIAPGSFAWAVPTCGKSAKTGLITLENASIYLEKLFDSPFLKGRMNRILSKPRASRIPLGPSPSTAVNRLIAVGDAAGQVKTTTGGGIYYGLIGAEAATAIGLESYKNGDFYPALLKQYHSLWQKQLGFELKAGLYFRKIFDKIQDSDLNYLTQRFKKKDLQDLLHQHANFDRHRDLIFALSKVPDIRAVMVQLLRRNFFPGRNSFSLC